MHLSKISSKLPKNGVLLEKKLRLTLSAYIKELLSVEEYAFSFEEVMERTSKSPVAVKREISRLIEKQEILNLRQGFYLIIPPQYAAVKKLPIQLYVEKLFAYLERRYYVGLFSAAKFYGASHQQAQRDYVIIEPPALNPIQKTNIEIQFLTTSNWPAGNIETKQSDAGYYRISSPALTFMDLIHYHKKIGGMNRILASLEELMEEINDQDLINVLSWYHPKSSMQRAGFLLEELGNQRGLADIIFDKLRQEPFFPVLLSPNKDQKSGATNNRWKVDINLQLQSDL